MTSQSRFWRFYRILFVLARQLEPNYVRYGAPEVQKQKLQLIICQIKKTRSQKLLYIKSSKRCKYRPKNTKFWSRDHKKVLTSAIWTGIFQFFSLFHKVSKEYYIRAKFHAIWSCFPDFNQGGG